MHQSAIAVLFLLIGALYLLTSYVVLSLPAPIDFSSFYVSAVHFLHGENPYQRFPLTFLGLQQVSSLNLNPPFFLVFMLPFASLTYLHAYTLWQLLSLVAFMGGLTFSFLLLPEHSSFRKNACTWSCIILLSHGVLTNWLLGQVGFWLFFLIMAGFYALKINRPYWCGLFWGTATAIKLFPALLFLHALRTKNHSTVFVMLSTALFANLIPNMLFKMPLLQLYFKMIATVYWYSHSWNASITGYIFRLFADVNTIKHNLNYLKYASFGANVGVFMVYLGWYRWWNVSKLNEDQHFCLIICTMLLLSPLSWIYYFPLLSYPFLYLWSKQKKQSRRNYSLTFLSLMLILFPMPYIELPQMNAMNHRIITYSLNFYGLILFAACQLLNAPSANERSMSDKSTHLQLQPLLERSCFISILGYTLYLYGINLGKLILHR